MRVIATTMPSARRSRLVLQRRTLDTAAGSKIGHRPRAISRTIGENPGPSSVQVRRQPVIQRRGERGIHIPRVRAGRRKRSGSGAEWSVGRAADPPSARSESSHREITDDVLRPGCAGFPRRVGKSWRPACATIRCHGDGTVRPWYVACSTTAANRRTAAHRRRGRRGPAAESGSPALKHQHVVRALVGVGVRHLARGSCCPASRRASATRAPASTRVRS